MKLCIVISAILGLVAAKDVRTAFREAMAKYAEHDHIDLAESQAMRIARFRSFAEFHARVEDINQDDSRPFEAADNFFSIMTPEERQRRLGRNTTSVSDSDDDEMFSLSTEDDDVEVPAQRDFSHVISDIKDQGDCGSCWAYGATSSLEGEIFFKTGNKKVSLSEQEYLECSSGMRRNGCFGGFSKWCFRYSKKKGRIAPTSAFPYEEWDPRECRANGKANALVDYHVKVVADKFVKTDEALLKLASQHIVTVAVYVNDDFQAYEKGVYTDTKCQKISNHEVGLVGYGESRGRKYWKIRNSWGKFWGNQGYILMDREMDNFCMINRDAHIPVVECRSGSTCNAVNPDDADASSDTDGESDDTDDTDDSQKSCEEKISLSSCLGSKAEALEKCKSSGLSKEECVIVRPNKPGCFKTTLKDKAKYDQGFVVRYPASCDDKEKETDKDGKCNEAAGMVFCDACNCCRHKHMC